MTGRVAGVEHEFEVRRDGSPVDFPRILGELDLAGRRLDPGDPNAVRCAWGGVITSDGPEAEIAIPPVQVEPGATSTVLDLLRAGRSSLESALAANDPRLSLRGYSTHLSIEIPDRVVSRVAKQFARRLALEIILLIDAPDSPGLLVRPRRNRLELGGEFVDGDDALIVHVGEVQAVVVPPRSFGEGQTGEQRLSRGHGSDRTRPAARLG